MIIRRLHWNRCRLLSRLPLKCEEDAGVFVTEHNAAIGGKLSGEVLVVLQPPERGGREQQELCSPSTDSLQLLERRSAVLRMEPCVGAVVVLGEVPPVSSLQL